MRDPRGVVPSRLVVVVAAAFMLARTFVGLAVPVLLRGDQWFFCTYAERMLGGERVYRDFFQFTPPGADLVFVPLFALFGPRVWVTDAVVVALGVLGAAATFRVARAMMDPWPAAFTALLVTVLVSGEALSATHHAWSALFILYALAFAARTTSRSPRADVAIGALLGVASFFTQTHGLAALVGCGAHACAQAFRHEVPWADARAKTLRLVAGFACALTALMAPFVVTSGAGPVFDCTVRYVVDVFGRSRVGAAGVTGLGLGLPETLTRASLPALLPHLVVYALVPLGYVLTVRARATARRTDARDDAEGRLLYVGVAMLGEVLVGLSWVRLFAVAVPGITLAVAAFTRPLASCARTRHALAGAAWLTLGLVAVVLVRSTWRHHSVRVAVPGGAVATDAAQAGKLAWIAREALAPGGLFAGDRPSLYLPLGLAPAVYLDAVIPSAQTTSALADRTIRELGERRVPLFIDSPELEGAAATGDAAGVSTLLEWVHARYACVHTFADGDSAWALREERR